MPAAVQTRSLYQTAPLPAVPSYEVYPLEMIRRKYMPFADMKMILNNYHRRPSKDGLPYLSVARSSYVKHEDSRTTSSSYRPLTRTVSTVVPENAFTPDSNYSERFLPMAPRIKTQTIPNGGPFMFLARKRKLNRPQDNGIVYSLTASRDPISPSTATPRDISSVTGRPYSRKRWLEGPGDNLYVAAFNGGATGPSPNERRYLQLLRAPPTVSTV